MKKTFVQNYEEFNNKQNKLLNLLKDNLLKQLSYFELFKNRYRRTYAVKNTNMLIRTIEKNPNTFIEINFIRI